MSDGDGRARGERDTSSEPRAPQGRAARLVPGALLVAIIAVYGLSLRGDFLNYDDDWLIRDNPVLHRRDLGVLRTIWTDLRPQTRDRLGAEYLPVRDTLVWLELRVSSSPHFLRATSLLIFALAALLLRSYLRRVLPPATAEIAAWLFALHPVHVESVAWLAGQKDLVALFFVAVALLFYARDDRWRWAVPLFVVAATLGKAVAVVAPLLLVLHDLLVGRRPRWATLAASSAGAAGILALHVHVGRLVGMLAPWPGGSRLTAFATMGPVWLRYLFESFVPVGLSVHHDVLPRVAADPIAWLGYGALAVLAGLAGRSARRGDRQWLWALGFFVVPLLPTSQVLAPLQNLMADRYLLLAVLGPCVVFAEACRRLPLNAVTTKTITAGAIVILGALTFAHAQVFTDSVSLWQDAAARSPRWSGASYQLALALRDTRNPPAAEAAFRRAIALAPTGDDIGRKAANNLAVLLVGQRRLVEAQDLLRDAAARFPDDPRALNNLAEVTARLGQDAEAQRLFESLRRRFPDYAVGQRNVARRFGAGVTAPAPAGTPPAPAPPPDR